MLMLGIAMWVFVPAPNIPTLLLAVGVPELALPLGAVFGVITIALVVLARGPARIVAGALGVLAVAMLSWPPLQAPAAAAAATSALYRSGIGPSPHREPLPVDVTADIRVPLRDGSALALDLYRPHTESVLPLIVTIYGGAWRFGSRKGEAPLARWYASRGYAVAVIDYRHTPAHRWPVQSEDVDDALRTIAAFASEWHIDTDRVALFGRSAGAQLALRAGERTQPLHVRAIVAYYAPSDLIGGWKAPPAPDPAHVRAILEAYLGGPPDSAHLAAYREAGPLQNARKGMPAVLAIGGDRDELVKIGFQRSFAAALNRVHVRNVSIELPWSNHSFDAVNGLGAAIARDATLRFLDWTIGAHGR